MSIPSPVLKKFNQLYASDIEMGVDLFVSECRTPVHKAFLDFDFEGPEVHDLPYYVELTKTVIQSFRRFYVDVPDDTFRCIILTRPPTELSGGHFKFGAHLIFPYLYVTVEMIGAIYGTVMNSLKSSFPRNAGENSWDKVFDSVCVEGHGIRMIGSKKAENCRKCNNQVKLREKCSCDVLRPGKIIHPEAYSLLIVVNHDGQPDEQKLYEFKNYTRLVIATSIRLPEDQQPTAGFAIYPGAPLGTLVQKKNRKTHTLTGFIKDKRRVSSMRNRTEVPREHDLYDLFEDYLQKGRMGPKYTMLTIKSISKIELSKITLYRVLIDGHNRRYCHNKQAEHKTNSIYFEIKAKGVSQRCFCSCPTKRPTTNKTCREYMSNPKALTNAMMDVLYPSVRRAELISDCPSTQEARIDLMADLAIRYMKSFTQH